ncbi:hypothetical protein V8C86DRAFT_2943618 [Haematococcus lacustris]
MRLLLPAFPPAGLLPACPPDSQAAGLLFRLSASQAHWGMGSAVRVQRYCHADSLRRSCAPLLHKTSTMYYLRFCDKCCLCHGHGSLHNAQPCIHEPCKCVSQDS